MGPFVGAGLIDSINPCAMLVLVFFVWLVFYLCRRSQDILVVGILFIVSIFITFSFLEFGTFEKFRSLELYYLLSKVLYLFIGIVMIFSGIFKVRDWWISLRGGDFKKTFLKTPALLSAKNHEGLSKRNSWVKLGMISLLSGFVFAFLASVCRGQPYLTMLAYISGAQHQKVPALLYVVIYNFLTVVPLLSVFLLIFLGVQSGGLARFWEKHFSKVKIVQAGVLLGLGFGLLFMFRS